MIKGKFREVADKNSYIKDNYVSKDRIREKMKNIEISLEDIEDNLEMTAQKYDTIQELEMKYEILQELLED